MLQAFISGKPSSLAVEVDEDRVGAFDLVEELGHVVMRLDLDRVRVERHAEAFLAANVFYRNSIVCDCIQQSRKK